MIYRIGFLMLGCVFGVTAIQVLGDPPLWRWLIGGTLTVYSNECLRQAMRRRHASELPKT